MAFNYYAIVETYGYIRGFDDEKQKLLASFTPPMTSPRKGVNGGNDAPLQTLSTNAFVYFQIILSYCKYTYAHFRAYNLNLNAFCSSKRSFFRTYRRAVYL